MHMSVGSQWEFYKIAWKSAVSINSQAKTFLEDQLDRVLYFIKKNIQYGYSGMNFYSTCRIW